MTDPHAELEAWLVDGATSAPSRELAVHAAVCDTCAARLGAFDALALVDVEGLGPPPPFRAPSPLRVALVWVRRSTAVAGTVVAAVLVVAATVQLTGLGRPGGLPEQTVLAGVGGPSAAPSTSVGPVSVGPEPAVAPAPTSDNSLVPGPSYPPPVYTQPPAPTPQPSVPALTPTPAPTPPPPPTLFGDPDSTDPLVFHLTWTAVAGADSYIVYRDGSPSPIQPGVGETFLDVPVDGAMYQVTAVSGGLESGPSNEVAEVSTPTPTPGPSSTP